MSLLLEDRSVLTNWPHTLLTTSLPRDASGTLRVLSVPLVYAEGFLLSVIDRGGGLTVDFVRTAARGSASVVRS